MFNDATLQAIGANVVLMVLEAQEEEMHQKHEDVREYLRAKTGQKVEVPEPAAAPTPKKIKKSKTLQITGIPKNGTYPERLLAWVRNNGGSFRTTEFIQLSGWAPAQVYGARHNLLKKGLLIADLADPSLTLLTAAGAATPAQA